MTDVTDEVLTGRTLGEFVLLDRIDEGGFGAVYRAKQDGLARPAVVKVLHRRAPDPDASLQRLVREAQLASRVDHPYAVHVYAFGVEDDGLLWIAMELVRGDTLEQWLAAHGPMPLEMFLSFFERVARVVQAAHEQGIVHRDLKPSNIMVVECGDEILPKLLDFGVAKLIDDVTGRETRGTAVPPADDGLTPGDCTLGSPSYMAPELWTEPSSAGPAADIYALAVIAFEALTGRRPFRADSARGLGVQHCFAPVPTSASEPLRRALSKQPGDRHDNAIDLAAALRAEATREQRQRRVRRIGAAAAIAMVAIVIGAVQLRATYETRFAQQRAEAAEHEARATELTAEVEQGRAALLAQDYAGARRHLGEAWRRGDHSRATEFMLDRAMQPLRAELARLPAARGRMWSASWSPDETRIATTDDAGAQIWDAVTYRPLVSLPHKDIVYMAVWTASRLVTACGDGAVRIWDAGGGQLVRELRLRGKAPRWYAVAVSPDGRHLAAVDAKGAIAVAWDAGTGAVLTELRLAGDGWPSIAFSADGRWLAASGGGGVQVVDATSWRRSRNPDFGAQVRAIAWNSALPNLLVGDASGSVLLWSAAGGSRPAAQLGEAVTAVAFAPDGARAAIGGEDGAELVIDTATARVVSRGNYLHVRIDSIAFSPDGTRTAAAGASGDLAIGDSASGPPVEVLAGSKQQLRGAWFGRIGHRVLAASWDGTARIWDARSPYRQWSALRLSNGFGLFGGVDPDGRYLAIACPGCATRVWDTAHDRMLAELPEVLDSHGDTPVAFPASSVGGDRAAVARGNSAELYEMPGTKLLASVAHIAPVTALAFESAGALLSGDAAGAVLETRGDTTEALAAPGGAGIDAIAALSGGRIAAADTSGHVKIFDGTDAPAVAFSTAGARARMLRVSPDGRRLLIVPFHAGRASPMVLIDVDHAAVISELDGPPVYAARWVSGGILSAHADGSARLWSLGGALLRTYTGGARFLADAVLSSDGAMVIGGGGDGLLRFWDMVTGKPLWAVAAHLPYVMGVHIEGNDIVTRGIGGEVARWHISASDAASYGSKSLDPLPNR